MAKSPLSIELHNTLIQDGYSEQFAMLVTDNLNTDYTAGRMITCRLDYLMI